MKRVNTNHNFCCINKMIIDWDNQMWNVYHVATIVNQVLNIRGLYNMIDHTHTITTPTPRYTNYISSVLKKGFK